jgi:hypothetical protein
MMNLSKYPNHDNCICVAVESKRAVVSRDKRVCKIYCALGLVHVPHCLCILIAHAVDDVSLQICPCMLLSKLTSFLVQSSFNSERTRNGFTCNFCSKWNELFQNS